jgi:hypothetical protein
MKKIPFIQSIKSTLVAPVTFVVLLGALIITTFSFNTKKPSELEATQILYSLGYSHIVAKAIHTASYYKLFDELVKTPKTAQEIADNKKFNAENLQILLRVLANHHIITMDEDQKFALNSLSRLLASHTEHSLQPAFAKEFDQRRWISLAHVDWAIEEGISPFKKLYSESFYEYLERDQNAAKLFNEGMAVFSQMEDEEIPTLYPFDKFKLICDVGGGTGSLISKVLTNYQQVQGILLELKNAIETAEVLKNKQFYGRLNGVVGSFFDKVPQADAFLVKRVIHNWGDQESIKILKNCVNALRNKSTGRIFVIEKVMPKTVDGSKLIDGALMGLALGAGKERSLEEFIALGKKADLKFVEKIDTKIGVSILVFAVEEEK